MMRAAALTLVFAAATVAQVAIQGDTVYTMAGPPVLNGVVLIRNGKIERVGPASQVVIPAGYRTLHAKVVTPGLVDAHSTLGLSGALNVPADQMQVERSTAMQPELRAIDAYNPTEQLIEYVRRFGVTTIHTGHGPGILISGQTMIAKTAGSTVEEATVTPFAMVAATLGEGARESERGKSPGSRSKAAAMLRAELIKAQEFSNKKDAGRDIHLEALVRVVKREVPLLVTVHRANDILTAIRIAQEFHLKLVLDGAAEAHLVLSEIKAAGYPVILHPTMQRAFGETENISMETAAKLRAAGIPFAFESGFESYVPKTRVVLFEAALAAANGLTFDQALSSITMDAARIIGVQNRVGSLEAGKDGDVALYDGDPFEYATHCVGVVLNGAVVSETRM